MAKTDVRTELLTATDIVQEDGEEESALAQRVAEYISNEMDEDAYAGLSTAATTWYEKAVVKLGKNQEVVFPVAALNGAAGPAASTKKATKKAPATPEKKIASSKKGVPEKKAPASPKKPATKEKASKPVKEKKEKISAEERTPRQSGTRTAIEMICKKPSITLEELTEKLAENEIVLVPLPAVYQRAKLVITTLRDMGKLA